MKRFKFESSLVLPICSLQLFAVIAWLAWPLPAMIEMPATIDFAPVAPGVRSTQLVTLHNRTGETIRCIGCSAMCGFGCTGAVELPFDIPPHEDRFLKIEFTAPVTGPKFPTTSQNEMTVYFDCILCREMKLKVRYTVLPSAPADGAMPSGD